VIAERRWPTGAVWEVHLHPGGSLTVCLFVSGDAVGILASSAWRAIGDEAVVAGLDVRHYLADIAAHPGTCRYMPRF